LSDDISELAREQSRRALAKLLYSEMKEIERECLRRKLNP